MSFPDGRLKKTITHDTVLILMAFLDINRLTNYVISMDNFFTRLNVMTFFIEIGFGCVGMARGAQGWPLKELKAVEDNQFNTLYKMTDKDKFLIVW